VAASRAFRLFCVSIAIKFFSWPSFIVSPLSFVFSLEIVVGKCLWGREEMREVRAGSSRIDLSFGRVDC